MVLRQLWHTLLINLLYGLSSPRIDNWGHMGGMVGGALAALALGPRWKATTLPGKRGEWLVDAAPLPWFRQEPRQLPGGGGRRR
jgi:membrane associated rhomboid family serine protease